MIVLAPSDPRLSCESPQPPDRQRPDLRLERFPRAAHDALAGQIGPLANLRSSTGCALRLRTDSPWVELRLTRLRHHQHIPCGVALEVGDGGCDSDDLRERDGDCLVRLPTGLERGEMPQVVRILLPNISTCAIAGLGLADGAAIEADPPPAPRWLALGDSLTQGFAVQSPRQTWVQRLARRRSLPVWNLGVGGLRIETEAVAWALAAQRWELVTIALGGNHAWRDTEAAEAVPRARRLAELALSGGHGRVVWCLPGWKPCEDGLGPPDFMGIPLDRAAGERGRRVREELKAALADYAPSLQVVGDLLPRDHRLFVDGLHPSALGFARYAEALDLALG